MIGVNVQEYFLPQMVQARDITAEKEVTFTGEQLSAYADIQLVNGYFTCLVNVALSMREPNTSMVYYVKQMNILKKDSIRAFWSCCMRYADLWDYTPDWCVKRQGSK